MSTIIVIGAGAAGMMAAGQAAAQGARVLLLEKTGRAGNKIRISGRGRCNLTNTLPVQEFIGRFNRAGRFLHQPFSRFHTRELMHFFADLDLPLTVERGGRVFPADGDANDVVDTLVRWLAAVGVKQRYNHPVEEILLDSGGVKAVRSGKEILHCERVILACGGASYPATGSSGDGCRLASACGHTIVPLRPALVPLVVEDRRVRAMAGCDLKNVAVRIYCNGKRRVNDFGEVSFTRFGIGGPVILTHSRLIVDALEAHRKVVVALDIKPALDEGKLDARLQRDLSTRGAERIDSVLRGLLPKEMVQPCLQLVKIPPDRRAQDLRAAERTMLRCWLKDFRMTIAAHRPLAEAIVTAGGVHVAEVTADTMESKCTPGLYLCGELLDIDGDTGGYNLQAAFSTGWLAGNAAAASLLSP